MKNSKRYLKNIVQRDLSVTNALKRMDEAGQKILFVADNDSRLLGTVTDGDIRRWILRGKSLNEKIWKAMNSSPHSLREGFSAGDAKQLMLEHKIESLPVLDAQDRVIGMVSWLDLFETKFQRHRNISTPVVIMAGGKGSRLAPFTSVLPKPLMPVGEKPIIEVIINRFDEAGCKEFYLSVNYKANIIKAYFDDFSKNYRIHYVQEKKPLGTVGSLRLIEHKLRSTFFLTNCDILIDADYADILRFHKANKNEITIVGAVKHYTIPYGICVIENGGKLKTIREKPEYNFLLNTGMYILEPGVVADIPKNRTYDITDLINSCRSKGRAIGVYPVSEKSWIDIGQMETLQELVSKYQRSGT
jgi:dTDP-glucose pyrophosphorylase/predicted transcriptional regulator